MNIGLTRFLVLKEEMMKTSLHMCLGAAAVALPTFGVAGTLDDVLAVGQISCGVSEGFIGFSAQTAEGSWEGFDVDVCRAVAAAVLGDSTAVSFVPTTEKGQFTALANGEVDILSRATAWSLSRDADFMTTFVGVHYYDGQGFMVPKALNVFSAKELDGQTVCLRPDTTSALNLEQYFAKNGLSYEPVEVDSVEAGQEAYLNGSCAVLTDDTSRLASQRATFEAPMDHAILNDMISKDPRGPVVRHGDDAWADIVRWSFFAMLAAEELGVTSANVATLAAEPSDTPEINRLLGHEGSMGAQLGLDDQWAVRILSAVGNYGESFERNLGAQSAIGLPRGLNALWTEGGLQYNPPIR